MPEGIQFDEEPRILYSRVEASNKRPKMVDWVIDKGWAGDSKKATNVLLIVAGVFVLLAILLPIFFGGRDNTYSVDPLTIQSKM